MQVMFLGTVLELLRRWSTSHDFQWFFCEDPKALAVGPLYFWSYVYYLSKYYEMLDTAPGFASKLISSERKDMFICINNYMGTCDKS